MHRHFLTPNPKLRGNITYSMASGTVLPPPQYLSDHGHRTIAYQLIVTWLKRNDGVVNNFRMHFECNYICSPLNLQHIFLHICMGSKSKHFDLLPLHSSYIIHRLTVSMRLGTVEAVSTLITSLNIQTVGKVSG